MKKLPAGEPSFSNIIEGNQLYVDKTEHYFRLMNEGKYYFISRPRRFGKSLLISTLWSMFKGEKELFEGLWIYDKYDFEPRPVILISFTGIDYRTHSLEKSLSIEMDAIGNSYGVTLSGVSAKGKFKELIQKLGQGKQVAVLIDEYDKPIIDYFDKLPQAIENRELLRNFFGILKDLDVVDCLHFVFITGVSKFSKVSLFSELNHLTDLTIEKKYAGMLGITQEELEGNFEERIEHLQTVMNTTREALLDRIRRMYNGYSWDGKTWVYNPFSLLRFFNSESFGNFWFASGTASFLVKAFKANREPLESVENRVVREDFFDKYEIEHIDLYSLMWQTGYLTIREVVEREESNWYKLGFPNNEVRNAFNGQLLENYSEKDPGNIQSLLFHSEQALLGGKPEDFIKELKAIFADIPYQALPKSGRNKVKLAAMWEGFFQTITWLIVKVLGINIQAEASKSQGRIDAVLETPKYIYIIEFKLEDSAANAMQQIKDKAYAAPFLTKQKKIFLLGIAFSALTRNVKEYLVEEIA